MLIYVYLWHTYFLFFQLPTYCCSAWKEGADNLAVRATWGWQVHHLPTSGQKTEFHLLRSRLHCSHDEPFHRCQCGKPNDGITHFIKTSQGNMPGGLVISWKLGPRPQGWESEFHQDWPLPIKTVINMGHTWREINLNPTWVSVPEKGTTRIPSSRATK